MAVFAGDGKDEGNWHMRIYNAHEGGIVFNPEQVRVIGLGLGLGLGLGIVFNPEQARVRVRVRVRVRAGVRVRVRHRLQPGAG